MPEYKKDIHYSIKTPNNNLFYIIQESSSGLSAKRARNEDEAKSELDRDMQLLFTF